MVSNSLYPALQMTEACNKKCAACLRLPYSEGYELTHEQFVAYQEDLRVLSKKYRIAFQFVTGGEPTIWKSEGRDIVDILSALSRMKVTGVISMPTNGKVFEEEEAAADLIERISSNVSDHIVVGISIAQYQKNLGERGYAAIDNILKICGRRETRIIPVALVTLSNDDDTSARLREIYPDLFQRITPLAPLGGGARFEAACPSMSLSGNDKSQLGSYLPYFRRDVMAKLKLTESEFDDMPNAEIMDGLSLHCHCGMSPFIRDKWHYCLPFKEDPSYELCPSGEMKEDTLESFIEARPLLKSIRKNGVISTVEMHRGELSRKMKDKLSEIFSPENPQPVAYRGCMICKKLFETGIFGEIESQIG